MERVVGRRRLNWKGIHTRVRVPDRVKESVECTCATFPSLLSGTDCLPHFVWDDVAESVPPPDEEEEEDNDVAIDREQEVEEDGDKKGK